MKESRTLELKREVARTFLKTASAFANYGTGKILFGVDDDGREVGLEDPDATRMAVENAMNDSLDPVPRFSLAEVGSPGAPVLELTVHEGPDKPYLYRGRAYRRADTADVEVDRAELGRLVLAGRNLSFERLPSEQQELSFRALARELGERAGVEAVDSNVLKTLGLYSDAEGFDNAAAILADENGLAGTDVVRFGEDDSVILDRERFVGVSAIEQLRGALSMYDKHCRYEKVEGSLRTGRELVPEEAFREAVANALVHRLWDSPANVQVAMRPGAVEVSSPGGLPAGISPAEYLGGHVSVLRNPVVASVFFRLGYIEAFGTGVARIEDAYRGTGRAPSFAVTENLISVSLPVLAPSSGLSADESAVLSCFGEEEGLSRRQVEERAGMGQAKAGRVLASLVAKGALRRVGSGRATRYEAP